MNNKYHPNWHKLFGIYQVIQKIAAKNFRRERLLRFVALSTKTENEGKP